MKSAILVVVGFNILSGVPVQGWAGEKPSPSLSPPLVQAETPKESAPDSPSAKKKSKGKIKREKEAEGTKALNRFDTEINTRSKYLHGGQPLEVDTD